uniref:N-formylglutamate amidohydrolase n=1 Tax=uncultured Erythrobacter sp. TaxID=263913 RepID=UPI0026171E19|nr:N-formylglutamate amidohydrolase [uncultured Erythrobacter sp.]
MSPRDAPPSAAKPQSAAPDQGPMRSVKGGAVLGELHGPAFTHVAPQSMPLPVLIAVPHAGRVYPSETLAQMRDIELSQLRLEDRFVDLLGVEIAKATGTGLMVAHAPRAMLDLNRADDDVDWEMVEGPGRRTTKPEPVLTGTNRRARSGLGLVPRRLPGFGEIWRQRLARDELDGRIDRIHRPYHTYLARELERIRDEWGAALLIDLHSMPPLRRQSGQEKAPTFVLGDRFGASCHNSLISRAFRFLDQQGHSVSHNRPYSGGYVLDRHASPPRGLHAMQVEVCRSAYLDDRLDEPTKALKPLAQMLAVLVRELGAETARLGASGQLQQAAE